MCVKVERTHDAEQVVFRALEQFLLFASLARSTETEQRIAGLEYGNQENPPWPAAEPHG